MKRISFAALLLTFLVSSDALAKTKITIVNKDKPDFGFNDPTPATPIGGNTGTTLGEQRLKAFESAADIWANVIDSDVEIRIQANFDNLACDATSAVLGQARAASFSRNFANAPQLEVLYPIALASRFAKSDLASGGPHIIATFNTFTGSGCSFKWYYGLDNNHGANEDLIVVLLHEFGHGLGFAGNVDANSGKYRTSAQIPSAFDVHVTDDTTGLRFDQMSEAQRATAATNTLHLVWDGKEVTKAVPSSLGPTPTVSVSAPASIARNYDINVAAFSGPFSVAGINGNLAAPQDVAEPADASAAGTTTDGCSDYQNASAITGRIALIDRGRCTFVDKATRAQAAGAIAVIIVDNRVATAAPGMGGTSSTIKIPILSLTQADGNALRAQLSAGVSLRIFNDSLHLSGTNKDGLPRLYAPSTVEGGSSLYHWDTSATPNLLMEPAISGDLKHAVDLTLYKLLDIGWTMSSNSGANPPPQLPIPGRRILKRGR